jgi:dTDP-4-amino-4,6-dideoxygalactose transaminase
MTIPYGRQDITDADIEAVTAVLHSDFLTQGPAIPKFEGAVAARVHAKHAIAVNSATAALHDAGQFYWERAEVLMRLLHPPGTAQ